MSFINRSHHFDPENSDYLITDLDYIICYFYVTDDGSSLSEACSTPIIGAGSRSGSSQTVIDVDDMDSGLHSGHLATRASLSSLGVNNNKNIYPILYTYV